MLDMPLEGSGKSLRKNSLALKITFKVAWAEMLCDQVGQDHHLGSAHQGACCANRDNSKPSRLEERWNATISIVTKNVLPVHEHFDNCYFESAIWENAKDAHFKALTSVWEVRGVLPL